MKGKIENFKGMHNKKRLMYKQMHKQGIKKRGKTVNKKGEIKMGEIKQGK